MPSGMQMFNIQHLKHQTWFVAFVSFCCVNPLTITNCKLSMAYNIPEILTNDSFTLYYFPLESKGDAIYFFYIYQLHLVQHKAETQMLSDL